MNKYPELSYYRYMATKELQDMYELIQTWSSQLVLELDTRDIEDNFKPAKQILTATTTTDISRPSGGAVVYIEPTGKYYGWNQVTRTWEVFN